MKKTDTTERGVNWGAVAVFLQTVERKAGILRRMAGQARDGVAELEEREFERRMAHIYRQLNLAWNGRHGNAFAPEPEERARRERFPEALRKEGEARAEAREDCAARGVGEEDRRGNRGDRENV